MCLCAYLKQLYPSNQHDRSSSAQQVEYPLDTGEGVEVGALETTGACKEFASTSLNCGYQGESEVMPFVKRESKNMVRVDETIEAKVPVPTRKKVVVFESRHKKDKLMVVDMHKLRNTVYNTVNQVYQRIKPQRNSCGGLSTNDGTNVGSDELLADGAPTESANENAKTKVSAKKSTNLQSTVANKTKSSQNRVGVSVAPEESNINEYQKMLKSMVLQTFENGLQKHGYSVNSSTAFVAEGGYGTVLRVYKDGRKYACKVISNMLFRLKSERGQLTTMKVRSRFANEVDIIQKVCSHPNVIDFVESFTDDEVHMLTPDSNESGGEVADAEAADEDNSTSGGTISGDNSSANHSLVFKNFFIVMEYANAKTLSYYIKNRRCLQEDAVKDIFRQVGDAVKYLHQHQIAHRDVKLSNLLLQSKHCASSAFNYVVKLCDFGLSSIVDCEDNGYMKPVGTSYYMAPEILRSYYFYNRKTIDQIVPYCGYKGDVWALGVCVFYCLHGYYPLELLCKSSKVERMEALENIFGNLPDNPDKSIDQIYLDRFRDLLRNYRNKLSFNCQDLLCRMLEVDSVKRANIVEVCQHIYLR